jgi:DNA-binding response OmpR family regulator
MKYRILVIEDDPHIAKILQVTLEHEGFEVLVAGDGQEGLKVAREEKPDLMLVDLMLPKIDGFKVCRLLKFDRKYKDIPVIILSARSEASDRELGRQVGAEFFMAKPFEPEVLIAKVREFLEIPSEVTN